MLVNIVKGASCAGQAKTIEEIHAEAHAELGMMPATLIPALESLSALPRQAADEVELFPSFKGGKGACSYALVSQLWYTQCPGLHFKPANEGPIPVHCCYLTA